MAKLGGNSSSRISIRQGITLGLHQLVVLICYQVARWRCDPLGQSRSQEYHQPLSFSWAFQRLDRVAPWNWFSMLNRLQLVQPRPILSRFQAQYWLRISSKLLLETTRDYPANMSKPHQYFGNVAETVQCITFYCRKTRSNYLRFIGPYCWSTNILSCVDR